MRSLRLAAILLAAATLAAQSPESPRGRAIGLVTDAAGAPVAGAEVVLWSWPLPERIDLGTPDRVATTTGANGRFSAEILDGRSHSAYATWQDAAGRHVTALAADVVPGVPCLLRAAAPRTCTSLVLRGDEDLRRWGTLRVDVVVGLGNPLVRALALDTAGQAIVPPDLPIGPTWIDVRSAKGQLLRSVPLTTDPALSQMGVAMPGAFPITLTIENRQGKRIADADVHVMHDFGYYGVAQGRVFAPDLLGRTGADGTLAVALPTQHPIDGPSPNRTLLLVTAPGHQRLTIDVVTTKAGTNDRMTVRLDDGGDLRARFVGHDGTPLRAGILPLYECAAHVATTQRAHGWVPLPPLPMRLTADGTWLGPGVHATAPARVFALVEADQLAALGLPLQRDFGVPPLLPIALTRRGVDGDAMLGDVSLERLVLARFVVVDAQGAPVAGARLRLQDSAGFPTPLDFRSDRVGRLQLPLPAGTWGVDAFAVAGGVAFANLTVPDDLKGDGRIELRLSTPRTLRGSIDAGGQPLPADLLVHAAPGRNVPRDLARIAYAALAATPVAADGTFTVQVPFGDARWELHATCGTGATSVPGPRLVVAMEDADLDDIQLSLPR